MGKQFLQSMTFLYHMTDANKYVLSDIMSMRVRGIADGMQSLKAPLKQAIPFTTDIVYVSFGGRSLEGDLWTHPFLHIQLCTVW